MVHPACAIAHPLLGAGAEGKTVPTLGEHCSDGMY
jgi:hypothetical protein